MRLSSLDDFDDLDPEPQPSWANVWHAWTIIVPRRSIDGSVVWGRVWRRYDGRRWVYKRIVGFEHQ